MFLSYISRYVSYVLIYLALIVDARDAPVYIGRHSVKFQKKDVLLRVL